MVLCNNQGIENFHRYNFNVNVRKAHEFNDISSCPLSVCEIYNHQVRNVKAGSLSDKIFRTYYKMVAKIIVASSKNTGGDLKYTTIWPLVHSISGHFLLQYTFINSYVHLACTQSESDE